MLIKIFHLFINILIFYKNHEKELLLGKLEEEENKIILQLRKEFAILQKQIHIHEREIKRIQGLVTKYANYRGFFLGELKREKNRNQQQNDIIANSKQVVSMKEAFSTELPKKNNKKIDEKNNNNNLERKSSIMIPFNNKFKKSEFNF